MCIRDRDEAKEILGTWIAPKDDGKKQTKKLMKKVTQWIDGLKKSKMSAGQAWVAITTRILKGLEWPLAASILSEAQCKRILSPLLKAGLRESKIQWRIHRDILFSSMGSMGLQFPYIYTTMGIQKARFLVDNGCKPHLLGHLTCQTHERLTLEMGLPGEIINWDYKDWGKQYATKSWISECWRYMSENSIQIHSRAAKLMIRRENDKFLMLLFYLQGFRKKELAALNRCRLYLHATTVAYIASMDGKHLQIECKEGEQHFDFTDESISWPIQRKPKRSDWNIWEDAVSQLTTPHHPSKLRQSLGKWISPRRNGSGTSTMSHADCTNTTRESGDSTFIMGEGIDQQRDILQIQPSPMIGQTMRTLKGPTSDT